MDRRGVASKLTPLNMPLVWKSLAPMLAAVDSARLAGDPERDGDASARSCFTTPGSTANVARMNRLVCCFVPLLCGCVYVDATVPVAPLDLYVSPPQAEDTPPPSYVPSQSQDRDPDSPIQFHPG
jgi:hypothetical protein